MQHHIWPKEYGGPTQPDNLVWTCDTGHYSIHVCLALMLNNEPAQGTREERRLAAIGMLKMRRAGRA